MAFVLMFAMVVLGGCETLKGLGAPLESSRVKSKPVVAKKPAVSKPATAPQTASLPSTKTQPKPPMASLPNLPPIIEKHIVLTPPSGVRPVARVGLLLPLSGPDAAIGKALLNAAQLVLFSIGHDNLALLPVDTRGTPEGAALAARTVLNDGASLILGPLFASNVAAVAPLAQARGIQVISFSNDRAVAGNGVYVMGFTPETQIGRVIAYAHARGVRRIASIVPTGAFGNRVEEVLRSIAARMGIEVNSVIRYDNIETATLSPLVRRLANYGVRKSALVERRQMLEGLTDEASKRALKRLEKRETIGGVDFDAVLMPEGGQALRALAPLLPFYDIDPRKVRVLGSVQWNEPVMATEPALFGGWFPSPPPRARRAFDEMYKNTYGRRAAKIASLAYDATALAAVLVQGWDGAVAPPALAASREPGIVPGAPSLGANAIFSPATSPAAFIATKVFSADALTAANGFSGADGIFRLMSDGLVQRGLAVVEIRSRRFSVVSPAPLTFEKNGK